MANLSLIMGRNIMISRCVDPFRGCSIVHLSDLLQIPKHSTTGYLFKISVSTEILDKRNSRFDLYHIVKICFCLFKKFYIGLDGDGPPIT
jgi:hypothetical protein